MKLSNEFLLSLCILDMKYIACVFKEKNIDIHPLYIYIYIYIYICMHVRINIHIYLSYLPTPPLGQDVTQGQFLSGI